MQQLVVKLLKNGVKCLPKCVNCTDITCKNSIHDDVDACADSDIDPE